MMNQIQNISAAAYTINSPNDIANGDFESGNNTLFQTKKSNSKMFKNVRCKWDWNVPEVANENKIVSTDK